MLSAVNPPEISGKEITKCSVTRLSPLLLEQIWCANFTNPPSHWGTASC